MRFETFSVPFLEAFSADFRIKKACKTRSRCWDAFLRLAPTSERLQESFRGLREDLAHVFPPQITPGRVPFRARRDHTTASGLQWRDPTRRGPEARRIF